MWRKKRVFICGTGVSLLIFAAISLWVYYCLNHNNGFLSGFAATSFAAFFSFILVLVGWWQLDKIHATSNADLLHKLKSDFFREESRILIHLIDDDYINFVSDNTDPDNEICYFKVNVDKITNSKLPQEIKEYLTKKNIYTTNEMDDFVLGHFEDAGLFWERGILDIDLIYEEFDDYIEKVYESNLFQEYLAYINKPEQIDQEEGDYYDKFKMIYQECKKYSTKKQKNG
jgi:hypothetical protein